MQGPPLILQETTKTLGRYQSLLFDPQTADVKFIIKGTAIPAHRCIVGSFGALRRMLYGDLQESKATEIKISDPTLDPESFKAFLTFIYTGTCDLHHMNAPILFDLANMYDFPELVSACEEIFEVTITPRTCLQALQASMNSNNVLMKEAALRVLQNEAREIFGTSQNVEGLSPSLILELVSSDELELSEILLFNFVAKWFASNPNCQEKNEILSQIRFGCISSSDLVLKVRPTKLAPPDLYLLALEYQQSKEIEIPRNFATPRKRQLKKRKEKVLKLIKPSYEPQSACLFLPVPDQAFVKREMQEEWESLNDQERGKFKWDSLTSTFSVLGSGWQIAKSKTICHEGVHKYNFYIAEKQSYFRIGVFPADLVLGGHNHCGIMGNSFDEDHLFVEGFYYQIEIDCDKSIFLVRLLGCRTCGQSGSVCCGKWEKQKPFKGDRGVFPAISFAL